MALSFSQGLRDFVAIHGGYKQALEGGIIEIRSGSAPATADAAVSGTLLCTVSQASGAVTKEVLSVGVISIGGASGTVDSITVNGLEILGAAVSFNGTIAQTCIDVAAQINEYVPPKGPKYKASAALASVFISALPGTGTSPNGYACTCTATTITGTNGTMGTGGTAAVGVCGSNGLQYGGSTAGVIGNSGVWSGVNIATGVAGYFRILSSVNDSGTAGTTLIRVQGVCGISSGDYPMTSTTLTAGQTHTVDSFSLTLPAA